jgi:cytidylate kinase
MPVITISRQFGAAGGAIGRELARRLGATFLDREIVAEVARRSGIPEVEAEGYDERIPSLWQRVAAALATSAPEVAMPPLPTDIVPASAIHERLATITRTIIQEAAHGDAVILGRGGVFIVGHRPDVLHVQLHASMDARVRYFLTQVEELPADARPDERSLRELCETFDRNRANYIRRVFGADWMDLTHYDLALDSGRLGVTTTVDLIEEAARRGTRPASAPVADGETGT